MLGKPSRRWVGQVTRPLGIFPDETGKMRKANGRKGCDEEPRIVARNLTVKEGVEGKKYGDRGTEKNLGRGKHKRGEMREESREGRFENDRDKSRGKKEVHVGGWKRGVVGWKRLGRRGGRRGRGGDEGERVKEVPKSGGGGDEGKGKEGWEGRKYE